MKLEKILLEIDKRITELKNKKENLIIKEMSIKKRNQLENAYQEELDKLYLLKHYGGK